MSSPEFNLTRIDRLRYRPTKSAEDFLGDLRSGLMPGDKARVARLAIARSLAEPSNLLELMLPADSEMGNAIEGIHLFGDDADLWASLIAVTADSPATEGAAFRSLVEAHWHRGAMLLKTDFEESGESDEEFVVRLASLVPSVSGRPIQVPLDVTEAEGPIWVKFGAESVDVQSQEAVTYVLNAPGRSPHLAILGKTRSGKTRTGLEIARQITDQAALPLIIIDPKGEFVRDGKLASKPEWGGETLASIFPGVQPLDVPRVPIPLDFLWRAPNFTQHDYAQLAIAFRDSFQKCLRARGDVALDTLRQAALQLLERQNRPISLQDVYTEYENLVLADGRSLGGIGAKLSEILSLNMILPDQSPPEFFSHRWVISFGTASDEPKKLSIFLLLDALNAYLMSLDESSVDAKSHRALRHLLIVDEAREILSYKHGALSSLIRRSASRGGVTMLLSQGPDDFDQEEDDFLEQTGTVGVFALSSANVRSLWGAFGRKIRVDDFADRALPAGVALVKLPGETARKILSWR